MDHLIPVFYCTSTQVLGQGNDFMVHPRDGKLRLKPPTFSHVAYEDVCPLPHFNFAQCYRETGFVERSSWPEVRREMLCDNRGLVGFQLDAYFDPHSSTRASGDAHDAAMPIGLAGSLVHNSSQEVNKPVRRSINL
jgi:hypothetical protein